MPVDPPLTDDESRVLDVLMTPNLPVKQRTLDAIVERTQLPSPKTSSALRGLESRTPPLVVHDVDEVLGTRVWWTTHDAADAVG